MTARAIWKGVLRLGQESVPVRMYSAAQDRDVHFHLLHDRDFTRVKQRIVNPETQQAVPHEEVRKGYPVAPDTFVLVKPEDIARTEPPRSRDIELARFVPHAAVPAAWYQRPYYLGPDGGEEAYFALATALRRRERVGIAHWVMRKKAYFGALAAHGAYLALIALHSEAEVVDTSLLEAPSGRELDSRELQLAEQLVSALAGPFDPSAFHDEHRARVLSLIERKARGEPVRPGRLKPPRRAAPERLSRTLEASLARVHKERRSA